ncbi:MAG TPA: hypothetical protein V6D35_14830 [Candidatus Sericytochromatia bacterium]
MTQLNELGDIDLDDTGLKSQTILSLRKPVLGGCQLSRAELKFSSRVAIASGFIPLRR